MDVLIFPDAVGWESWLAAQHGVRAEAVHAQLEALAAWLGLAAVTIA